jgi:hypothetical protein
MGIEEFKNHCPSDGRLLMGREELRAIAHKMGCFLWEEQSSEPLLKRWKGSHGKRRAQSHCS